MGYKKSFAIGMTVVMLGSLLGCAKAEENVDKTVEHSVQMDEDKIPHEVTQNENSMLQKEEGVHEYPDDPLNSIVEYGDEVHFCCYRSPIIGQWVEQGDVSFEVDIDAEQFQHGDYELDEASLRENVEEAVGKGVGESFTVPFEYGDCRVFNRYTILDIEKNSALGNQRDSVEYGDTIHASYKRAECMAEYATEMESLGGAVLKVDEATTQFIECEAVYPEAVVKDIVKKAQGQYRWSGNLTSCDDQYEYYFYVNMVNSLVEPSYQLPENWDYQFAIPQIGSFKGYNDEDAGAIDIEDGEYYGFDDRLTLGCSNWCGCYDYLCEVQTSSTLATQGNISYDASNLVAENRNCIWAEGVEGTGIGESICIKQMYAGTGDAEFTFNSICIVNGYAQNQTKWQENGRVKSLKLYYEDEYMGLITLEDTMKPQYIDVSPVQMKVGNGFNANFRFEIAEVYEGTKYEDTCITGIVIDFEGKYAH